MSQSLSRLFVALSLGFGMISAYANNESAKPVPVQMAPDTPRVVLNINLESKFKLGPFGKKEAVGYKKINFGGRPTEFIFINKVRGSSDSSGYAITKESFHTLSEHEYTMYMDKEGIDADIIYILVTKKSGNNRVVNAMEEQKSLRKCPAYDQPPLAAQPDDDISATQPPAPSQPLTQNAMSRSKQLLCATALLGSGIVIGYNLKAEWVQPITAKIKNYWRRLIAGKKGSVVHQSSVNVPVTSN